MNNLNKLMDVREKGIVMSQLNSDFCPATDILGTPSFLEVSKPLITTDMSYLSQMSFPLLKSFHWLELSDILECGLLLLWITRHIDAMDYLRSDFDDKDVEVEINTGGG